MSPCDLWGKRVQIKLDGGIVNGVFIRNKFSPLIHSDVKSICLRSVPAASEIFESGGIGRDESCTGSGLNGHVAYGHPLFHGTVSYGLTGEFDDMTGAEISTVFADQSQYDIFCSDARIEHAGECNVHRPGFLLLQALGRHNMFHFAGADTEGECAECAVGCSVAVAADDGFAWSGQTEFGTDDMNDALLGTVKSIQSDVEFSTVFFQGFDLFLETGSLILYLSLVGTL